MPAQADDFGCTVLLCLANPAGPMAVAECVPPITRLYEMLAEFQPFPTCVMASGPDGNSWAQQGTSWYDLCPTGTTPLAVGAYAAQNPFTPNVSPYYLGIGDGSGQTGGMDNPLGDLVCVGTKLSIKQVLVNTGFQESQTITIGIYDQVVVSAPESSDNIIDVYINNVIFQRVHW